MKKNIILAVFCLILSAISFAQVPQKMSYQAVVRGSDNNLVTNQQVAMRVSILQGSVDGTAVYTETHSATTNANGLVSIEIGDGTSNDDFTAINWANGPFFVKTETDVNGGDDYDIIGVSQLLSVPYAMYAQTAGNMPDVSGFLTEETDPTVSAWAKAETKPVYNYSEIEGTPEIPTVPTNVSAFENDANYLQSESDPTVPSWAKANTKPVYNYSEIEGTPAIPTVPTNVSAFTNDANYVVNETDPTIPDWAKANAKPTYSYDEITGKPELFSGNYNDLTNKPTIPTVPTLVSAFTNDANYISSETQTLADVAALGNSLNTQLKNVTDPTDAQDAVTKAYVDALIAQLQAAIDAFTTGTLNGHDWVDLGLPSGTRWATCNVGANNPEGYGDYFAWGETSTKTTYSSSAYTYSGNPTTLPSSADAATANWGSGWRMPTKEEFDELKNNCTVTWTTQNGVNGRLFTGPNGASIFLPAAGNRYDDSLGGVGSYGYYRSSSLGSDYPSYAWYLYFDSDYYFLDSYVRYYGRSVRPVCAQ